MGRSMVWLRRDARRKGTAVARGRNAGAETRASEVGLRTMVVRSLHRAVAVGALFLGCGLTSSGPARAADALVAVGDELSVGKNKTGETCKLRLVESRSTRLGACSNVEPTTLGVMAAPAGLRECRRQDGDFRAVVVGAIIGRRGYALEAFPTNLPVLEAGVEVLEGKRAPADAGKPSGGLSGAIRRAETMVDSSGKLTAVGEVGAHALFYRLGTLRNYAGDYAGSEEAFRRALEIEEKAARDQPSSGRTMCWIALNVGYQQRFDEAEALFARAEPLVKKGFVAADLPLCLAHHGNVEHARG